MTWLRLVRARLIVSEVEATGIQRRSHETPLRSRKVVCLLFSCDVIRVQIMSTEEIIEQIKGLPAAERAKVAKYVLEEDESSVPESFKEGMADAEAGRFVDMETVLSGAKPPPRRKRR